MGLSSSQARLLNLTARMHQIEYKAAKVEAMKLQMANESTRVYEEYLEALDKTKIQYKILTTDGSTTYTDIASYSDFLSAGYAINYDGITFDGSTSIYRDSDGNLTSSLVASYTLSSKYASTDDDGNSQTTYTDPITADQYAALEDTNGYEVATYTDDSGDSITADRYSFLSDDDKASYTAATYVATIASSSSSSYTDEDGNEYAVNITVDTYDLLSDEEKEMYVAICNEEADDFGDNSAIATFDNLLALLGITQLSSDFEAVMTNIINSGMVTLVSVRDDGTFAQGDDSDYVSYETSVATDTGLQEVTDSIALKKAEAQYEADMKKIDAKDTKYDTDLAAIENERNAIKTEMDTLETVASDNVERTFKIFS